jgi:hypothetical protein
LLCAQKNGNFKEALKAMMRQASMAMSTHELKARHPSPEQPAGSAIHVPTQMMLAAADSKRDMLLPACPLSRPPAQEVESSLIALRNAKAKEEREAAQKAAKKATAKAKPQLKGNIDGDLDDVRYAREALDDEYDFM